MHILLLYEVKFNAVNKIKQLQHLVILAGRVYSA